MPKKVMTLCIVHQPPRVLLGYKKFGFGAGRWNGFGGKVMRGETVEAAMIREIQEEAGITPEGISYRGRISARNEGDDFEAEFHIFAASGFSGNLSESDEMRPQWFYEDKLPYEQMWPDDRHWYPLFLAGKSFQGIFHLRDHSEILHFTLEELR